MIFVDLDDVPIDTILTPYWVIILHRPHTLSLVRWILGNIIFFALLPGNLALGEQLRMDLPLGEVENFFTEVNNDLDSLSQSVANNAAGGCFMDKTYNFIATILDGVVKHNHAWNFHDQSGGVNAGIPSLTHFMKENQDQDQMMATIVTNIALLTKKLIENKVKKVHAVEEVPGVPPHYSQAYPLPYHGLIMLKSNSIRLRMVDKLIKKPNGVVGDVL
ncbi:hypothetical protein HAX54_040282, partial [Datura stramonium]|nr:hypothetical protein [Datura stramonium]